MRWVPRIAAAAAAAAARARTPRAATQRLIPARRPRAPASVCCGKRRRMATSTATASTATAKEATPPPQTAPAAPAASDKIVHTEGVAEEELEGVLRARVVPALRADGVVAVPTDTIYGLATRAQSTAGVAKLYGIKGRDLAKPIAICVASVADMAAYGQCDVVDVAMLRELLPGPVTVVLRRTPALNAALNPHTDLIGIRVPDHTAIMALVRACGGDPLALTSANRSSKPSTVAVDEFRPLWPSLDAIVDAGRIEGGDRSGSTVVDLSTQGRFRIIRPGSAHARVCEVLGRYGLAEVESRKRDSAALAAAAPAD